MNGRIRTAVKCLFSAERSRQDDACYPLNAYSETGFLHSGQIPLNRISQSR